jgi:16S rRNA G966 N2-methylase RsmD
MAVFPVQSQCLSVFLPVSVRVYEILRRYIEDESVDLVHLDPPFKNDQDYNILFAERGVYLVSEFNGDSLNFEENHRLG